jgi:hypothetical protein
MDQCEDAQAVQPAALFSRTLPNQTYLQSSTRLFHLMHIPEHVTLNDVQASILGLLNNIRPHLWCASRIMYGTRYENSSLAVNQKTSMIIGNIGSRYMFPIVKSIEKKRVYIRTKRRFLMRSITCKSSQKPIPANTKLSICNVRCTKYNKYILYLRKYYRN